MTKDISKRKMDAMIEVCMLVEKNPSLIANFLGYADDDLKVKTLEEFALVAKSGGFNIP